VLALLRLRPLLPWVWCSSTPLKEAERAWCPVTRIQSDPGAAPTRRGATAPPQASETKTIKGYWGEPAPSCPEQAADELPTRRTDTVFLWLRYRW